jgi:drug/metabolite transporter (DMT)-like permease
MKARVSDLTAIFFAVFGFTCWVLGDSCIKWIGQFGLPPEEIVAFMGLFMALTLTVQAAVRRNLGNLRPRSVARQGLRALLDTANNLCVVIALRHLSLTMFYILVFTSPLTIALLSAIFLGERMTTKKAVALVAGFCGVVIAYSLLLTRENMAPCGSWPLMIQPPPGTCMGPFKTLPPPDSTRLMAALMESTWK